MHRSNDYDSYVAGQLRDPEYRQSYLLALMSTVDGEEGLSPLDALVSVIGKMGVTEFADLAGMQRSSVARIISQKSPPKLETMDKMLAPFGLKVKIDVEKVA